MQLLLMQNPRGPLASGGASPSGATIPARSAPRLGLCPRARTSSPLSARSGAREAHFCWWIEFLNLCLTGGDKKYVTESFVTLRGECCFSGVSGNAKKRDSVAELQWSGLQNDEIGKLATCPEGLKTSLTPGNSFTIMIPEARASKKIPNVI